MVNDKISHCGLRVQTHTALIKRVYEQHEHLIPKMQCIMITPPTLQPPRNAGLNMRHTMIPLSQTKDL